MSAAAAAAALTPNSKSVAGKLKAWADRILNDPYFKTQEGLCEFDRVAGSLDVYIATAMDTSQSGFDTKLTLRPNYQPRTETQPNTYDSDIVYNIGEFARKGLLESQNMDQYLKVLKSAKQKAERVCVSPQTRLHYDLIYLYAISRLSKSQAAAVDEMTRRQHPDPTVMEDQKTLRLLVERSQHVGLGELLIDDGIDLLSTSFKQVFEHVRDTVIAYHKPKPKRPAEANGSGNVPNADAPASKKSKPNVSVLDALTLAAAKIKQLAADLAESQKENEKLRLHLADITNGFAEYALSLSDTQHKLVALNAAVNKK